MHKRWVFLLCIVFWLTAATTLHADLTIWANNGEDKVTRDDLRVFNNGPTVVYNSVWSGTVTPTLSCYTFSPVNQAYTDVTANRSGQNYTAAASNPNPDPNPSEGGGGGGCFIGCAAKGPARGGLSWFLKMIFN